MCMYTACMYTMCMYTMYTYVSYVIFIVFCIIYLLYTYYTYTIGFDWTAIMKKTAKAPYIPPVRVIIMTAYTVLFYV